MLEKTIRLRKASKCFALFLIIVGMVTSYSWGISSEFALGAGTGKTYFVSNRGDDTNPGTSPELPWKTIAKVNSSPLNPGDTVCLEKGGEWREQLIPQSGSEVGDITYTFYGSDEEKPLLLGSVSADKVENWVDTGNNIWEFQHETGPELLSNPGFDVNTKGWTVYSKAETTQINAGRDTTQFVTTPAVATPASLKIECINNGETQNDLQIFTMPFSLTKDKLYKLSFYAKCTTAFTFPSRIQLMMATSPWTSYAINYSTAPAITTDWKRYDLYYKARTTATNGRMNIYLGNALPDGATFYIDSVSLTEIFDKPLDEDVGNIIINNGVGELCGIKVWNESELNGLNKFWYDKTTWALKMYSDQNPALKYNDIECALRRPIIDEANKSYITYDGLQLAFGAGNGIGGGETHHITIRNCDIYYIGGGEQYLNDDTKDNIRYGNGIEFWDNAHDNIVDGCKIWEVYDEAVTNQGNAEGHSQYNIYFINNVISNCEYSYSCWAESATSTLNNIHFDNNICSYAGYVWSHNQRYRNREEGWHIYLPGNKATNTSGISIQNNTFSYGTEAIIVASKWYSGLDGIVINNNTYRQTEGKVLVRWKSYTQYGVDLTTYYHTDDFLTYQNETQKDKDSIIIP